MPEKFVLYHSTLFVRQWKSYAQDYKHRAGLRLAKRFVSAVDEALAFIQKNPYACPAYDAGEEDLRGYGFGKCNLRFFPHLVLFHIEGRTKIFIDALYAHKMNIVLRMGEED